MTARTAIGTGFQYALLIFILTALIGLANASKLFGELSRDTLLTHLHSGTLGWITMGVFAVAAWIFGASSASLGRNFTLSAAATALYVLAFWSGNFYARAAFGTIELVVILAWWWWVAGRVMAEGFGAVSVPKLSLLGGLTTLIIGSTLGVLAQIQFASGTAGPQTGQIVGGHAAAQVGGYLILVGAGLAEWRLDPNGRRTIFGALQVLFLFVSGILFAIGAYSGTQQLLMIANMFQLVAVVMIAVRVGRKAISAPWGAPTGQRHFAIAIGYLLLSLLLFVLLVQEIGKAGGDFSKVPPGMIHALDHTTFVGLMTNVLFGAILVYLADRPRIWPWADAVIFWGLNIGALSFIATLVFVGSAAGSAPFSHPVSFTAPIMGLSAVLGIVTFLMRLRGTPSGQPVMAASPA